MSESGTLRGLAGALVAITLLGTGLVALTPSGAAAPTSGWSWPQLIEQGDGGVTEPVAAADADGNVMVVWLQYGPPYNSWDLWSAHYDRVKGWAEASHVGRGGASWVFAACDIDVDSEGRFIAVAALDTGAYLDLWAFIYEPGTGWGAGTKLDTSEAGDVWAPQIAVHPDGSATVVWAQFDGARDNIWQSRYVKGSGWTTADFLEADDAGGAMGARVAADVLGDAMVVWMQSNGTTVSAMQRTFGAGGAGWGSVGYLEGADDGDVASLSLVARPGGGFLAVWTQSNGSLFSVMSRQSAGGGVWGAIEYVEFDDTQTCSAVKVGIDAQGSAFAVYMGYNATTSYRAMASRLLASGTWEAPVALETLTGNPSTVPVIIVSPSGLAVALFQRLDPASTNLVARVYSPGTGWAVEQLIEDDDTQPGFISGVGLPDGSVAALWGAQSGSIWSVYTARYVPSDLTPPALAVSAPVNGSRTNHTALRITGTTEPGASVTAGGVEAHVDAAGRFDFVVPLDPGLNDFSVQAIDAWGNTASVRLQVTFDDPVGALEADLTSAVADVAAAQADLADARADLAASQTALVSAQARLAALEANGTASAAQLAQARAEVDAAELRVASLEAGLASANAKINQTSGGGGVASSDPLPLILGLLGVVLGGVALALGFLRRGGGGASSTVVPAGRPVGPGGEGEQAGSEARGTQR